MTLSARAESRIAIAEPEASISSSTSLALDAFVRSVSVNARVGHMLLLGAGASVSSNVPSAAQCVWDWKRSIFLSNHPGVERSFQELSLRSVQDRIQLWLDKQPSFPTLGAETEYGFYIEHCYPVIEDRRAFFQRHVQAAKPSRGYRLAARLAQAGLIRSVWTTNFDGLVARALSETSVTPVEVGLDSANRLVRTERAGELPCVFLHGDYRYDDLKNTDAELRRLDEDLRKELVERTVGAPLIVLGYSGRDKSVMDALTEGYSRPGAGALFWCGYGDGPPPNDVARLIATARGAGRTAFYVPGAAFDDVMRRLALAVLTGQARDEAFDICAQSDAKLTDRAPFTVPSGRIGGILKSTAFRLRCPVEAYSFKPTSMPDSKVWAWLRDITTQRKDLIAVPYRGRVWAFRTLTAIQAAFVDGMEEAPQRVPIDINEVRHEDGAITHLMIHALAASIAATRQLSSEGALLWDPGAAQAQSLNGKSFKRHDAVLLYIRRIGQDIVLVLKPTIKVFKADGSPAEKEDEKAIKLGVFGYQHNDKFNDAVEGWRKKLIVPGTTFSCPAGEQTGFEFSVDRAPISAAILAGPKEAALPDATTAKATQRGFKVLEPHLLFGSKGRTGTPSDPHPIRGLVENRPFDFDLTRTGLATDVRLGAVCPQSEARNVGSRLLLLEQPASPNDSERDYLLDFPGFSSAFGLPLSIPQPGDIAWRAPTEPNADAGKLEGTRFVARALIQAIDELRAAQRINVILIVTPKRWANWRSYDTDAEHFDVHDFVKAYCARRGIATQFIDEETLTDAQACRIRWWLSLALYAKSFRTPFVLQAAPGDTAYVGFGTSVDRHGSDGQKVVLGCMACCRFGRHRPKLMRPAFRTRRG